jgi:hypothetical protein
MTFSSLKTTKIERISWSREKIAEARKDLEEKTQAAFEKYNSIKIKSLERSQEYVLD